MPFVTVEGLDELQDEKLSPEGSYSLLIVAATDKDKQGNDLLSKGEDGKPKRKMVRVSIRNEDLEDASLINHMLVFPVEEDEKQTRTLLMRNIKRFLTVFNVPIAGGFNVDDLEGARGECLVALEERNDKKGEFQNVLKLPKFE